MCIEAAGELKFEKLSPVASFVPEPRKSVRAGSVSHLKIAQRSPCVEITHFAILIDHTNLKKCVFVIFAFALSLSSLSSLLSSLSLSLFSLSEIMFSHFSCLNHAM